MSSFGRTVYEGVRLPVWFVAPPKIRGCSPTRAGEAGTLGLRSVFCPAHVRAKNGFYLVPPAAAGGSLRRLPSRARGVGRRRWGEPYGANPDGLLRRMERCGRLRRVPSRASPWDGGVGGSPMGRILMGYSVGWSVAADCGVCPSGRVHGTEASGNLWPKAAGRRAMHGKTQTREYQEEPRGLLSFPE